MELIKQSRENEVLKIKSEPKETAGDLARTEKDMINQSKQMEQLKQEKAKVIQAKEKLEQTVR